MWVVSLVTAAFTAAAGVPAGCTGWPGPNTFGTETNYSNADLPPLLEFLNGELLTCSNIAEPALYLGCTLLTTHAVHTQNTFIPQTGSKVVTKPAWEARRDELKYLLQKYFYGTLPKESPPLVSIRTHNHTTARGVDSWNADITFLVLGETNVTFQVEMMVPNAYPYQGPPGKGQFCEPLCTYVHTYIHPYSGAFIS